MVSVFLSRRAIGAAALLAAMIFCNRSRVQRFPAAAGFKVVFWVP